MKRQTRTGEDGTTSVIDQGRRYRLLVNDREAPGIQRDPLGEQFSAHSVTVTQDGVDHEGDTPPWHRCACDPSTLTADATGRFRHWRPALGGGTRQECRRLDRAAGTVAKVPVRFVTKDHKCAADKPGDAIGVAACATSVDEVAQFVDWWEVAPERCRVVGQDLELCRQVGQTVDTGSTLARTLALHVADHSSRLGQGAVCAGEKGDDPGAEGRMQRCGRPPRSGGSRGDRPWRSSPLRSRPAAPPSTGRHLGW